MTEPIRSLFFRSLGASIFLHLFCAVFLWKTYVPATDLQDSSPLMVRLLRPADIPKFIDQPNAPEATKPVHSKDISQVTSEARARGRIPRPGSPPETPKTRRTLGSPAILGARQGAGTSPREAPRMSLREQVAALGSLELSGDEGAAEAVPHGEAGADERTVSLETQSSEFAPYLAGVRRRIIRVWNYPYGARSIGLTGQLIVVFSVIRDGSLAQIRVTESSGVSLLDEAAVKAVKTAAPYGRFPAEFSIQQLNIIASFEYVARAAPVRQSR